MNEDMTLDEDLENIPPLEVVPKSEMIRGEYTFKGQPLWPWSTGTRVLYNQMTRGHVEMLFAWPSFVFLLLKRGEPTASLDRKKYLVPLWEAGELKAAALDWIDGLTEEDLLAAKDIYDKWMAADQATAVEPISEGVPVEKKTRRKNSRSSVG